MPNDTLPDWEQVLAAAAHLQRILPGAVLVGGSAAAVYAAHRLSTDADHVLTDLRQRFDQALADLEAVAGWKTARVKRPVQILGSLDGIETGVRQLIRDAPLENVMAGDRLRVRPGDSVPVDAEVIDLAWSLITGLGIPQAELVINSVGCATCRPVFQKALLEALGSNLTKLCGDCQRRSVTNPLRIYDLSLLTLLRGRPPGPKTLGPQVFLPPE